MSKRSASQEFQAGVRACITWLHEEAKTMNDPNARAVLNNAAFHLGVQKPTIHVAPAPRGEEGWVLVPLAFHAAAREVVEAAREFREGFGPDWEGDPLADACADLEVLLAAAPKAPGGEEEESNGPE